MSVKVLVGDARAVLKTLPDESVDCCVTSPPYMGLRAYGDDAAELGREGTVQGFVLNLVDVFAEVRRVLKPRGTCFLNLGDCYAGSKKGLMADGSVVGGAKQRTNKGTMLNTRKRGDRGGISGKQASNSASLGAGDAVCPPGFKPKDLMMIPNRVAIALQDDGWWVRNEIVWGKPNPMPSSVTDRLSNAHEKIWLLTKSGHSYYDNDAGQVPSSDATAARAERADYAFGKAGNGRNDEKRVYAPRPGGPNGYNKRNRELRDGPGNKQDGAGNRTYTGFNARWKESGKHKGHDSNTGFSERWKQTKEEWMRDGQKAQISKLHAKREQHTGMGRRLRDYEEAPLAVWRFSPAQFPGAHYAVFPPELVERALSVGCPVGGTVLDPFGGSGTVGLVALHTGREAILIDLYEKHAAMARERIASGGRLDAKMRRESREAAIRAKAEEQGQEALPL